MTIMPNKTDASTVVKMWGNSMAVRLPTILARGAHLHPGSPVNLTLKEGNIIIHLSGKQTLTLDEMLEKFDPKKHGGEFMASGRVGAEEF